MAVRIEITTTFTVTNGAESPPLWRWGLKSLILRGDRGPQGVTALVAVRIEIAPW